MNNKKSSILYFWWVGGGEERECWSRDEGIDKEMENMRERGGGDKVRKWRREKQVEMNEAEEIEGGRKECEGMIKRGKKKNWHSICWCWLPKYPCHVPSIVGHSLTTSRWMSYVKPLSPPLPPLSFPSLEMLEFDLKSALGNVMSWGF